MYICRTLLDPENMLASVNKSEKTDFLNHFYKHCMHVFIGKLAYKIIPTIYSMLTLFFVFSAPTLKHCC